jgi:hypothetical protein
MDIFGVKPRLAESGDSVPHCPPPSRVVFDYGSRSTMLEISAARTP